MASSARVPTTTVSPVLAEHVERLLGVDAEPLALTDGELVLAAVAAERAPGAVDDRPRPLAHAAVAREERRLAGAGQEAEVLRLALIGDGQAGVAGERAHLRLGQLAEREAHPRDGGRRERGEHVRLVLGGVGCRSGAARRA